MKVTQPEKKTLVLPMLLITLGAGSLLSALGFVPSVDWIWTLGLAAVGLITLAVSGIDKVSIVVGPFFLGAAVLSILRQTEQLRLDLEVPILVILAGFLLLIARRPAVPMPGWIAPESSEAKGDNVPVTGERVS